jgi:hypothetical protein
VPSRINIYNSLKLMIKMFCCYFIHDCHLSFPARVAFMKLSYFDTFCLSIEKKELKLSFEYESAWGFLNMERYYDKI